MDSGSKISRNLPSFLLTGDRRGSASPSSSTKSSVPSSPTFGTCNPAPNSRRSTFNRGSGVYNRLELLQLQQDESAVMSPVPSSASLSSMIQPEQLEQMPRAGGSAVSADWYLNEGNPAKADPEKSFPTLMLRGFDISLKNYREGCKRLIDMMDGTKVENWDFAKNNDGSPVERHCLRLRSLFGSAFETDLPWFFKEHNSAGVKIPETWKYAMLAYWCPFLSIELRGASDSK